ncbi:DNA gyrase subunit A [Candidatus Peregrinibacteria bacterium]|jgi:DNA gyrase subunit A|nr:DNA gyrase subunit A [Candidatus Peregrinibacteria bacterium]
MTDEQNQLFPEENKSDPSSENSSSGGDDNTQVVARDTSYPQKNIVNEMEASYLEYAMSVIVSRALPDVRDGLKPVHRRILYAMHKLGITSGGRFVKSARVVGEVIGKYHPHGDSSVYDAMVRLAQDFSMRYPLIWGQGNFGSLDGDNAAAMRYTEAKMQKITAEILADLEKETVDFRDNYDGSLKEPRVMPSKLPALLLNGTMGIAVGMATNIPPHNIREIYGALKCLLANLDATLDDLLEHIQAPDFPTGGLVYDKIAIREAYATGRGSVIMRGRAEIEELKSGRSSIIISEIPYQVNKENLVIKIADLVREKKIQGISELRDESSRGDVRIYIEIKKDAFPNKILNQLFQLTPLQSSFGFNMVVLTEGGLQPKLLNLREVLEEFIKHRFEVITRRTEYELKIAEARAHILEGLKKALDDIDAIIACIRASKTKEMAKEELIKQFGFTELQADAILSLRLQTLAGLERQKITDELAEKLKFIGECKTILGDPKKVREIMGEEFDEIVEKYGDDRRTEVIPHGLGKFDAKDVIPNEDMIVSISSRGYIKRVAANTYKSQGRGGKGIKGASSTGTDKEKEEDTIINLFHTKNHNKLLFFTDRGRCFKLEVYEIPQASRTAKGQALPNFLQLDNAEKVTAVLDTTANQGKYLFMATTSGTVKKTPLEDFANVRRNGLIAIKLKEDNLLQWVKVTSGEDMIMMITSEGKSIRFNESDVRSMGRSASGVRGIRLKGHDKVVEMDIVKELESAELLVTMENGLGKMTKVGEYREQSRGGSGVKVANITPKTGKVAGAKIIETQDRDLMIISNEGLMIRMALSDVPSRGRATQGVIIMRMKKSKDKVASIMLIPREEEELGLGL